MNFKRIIFVISILLISFYSCNSNKKENTSKNQISKEIENPLFFKLSLAQWSLNKQIRNGEMNPFDFAQRASEMGFEGIEYVSQLYKKELTIGDDPKISMQNLLTKLKEKSKTYKVENVLIMIDGEGDLATENKELRDEAVENHKKWVDAAQFLGCHSIRVNLSGSNEPEIWVESATDGLSKLANYASKKNINVIVENHGGLSSNAGLLFKVIINVNLPNCGALPDFGNFCIKKDTTKERNCIDQYDTYKGIEELMPVAFAVSAKSYDFDKNGNETTLDYKRILQIVKKANYTGFIGVEYEGGRLSEEEGIIATKKLLIKSAKELK